MAYLIVSPRLRMPAHQAFSRTSAQVMPCQQLVRGQSKAACGLKAEWGAASQTYVGHTESVDESHNRQRVTIMGNARWPVHRKYYVRLYFRCKSVARAAPGGQRNRWARKMSGTRATPQAAVESGGKPTAGQRRWLDFQLRAFAPTVLRLADLAPGACSPVVLMRGCSFKGVAAKRLGGGAAALAQWRCCSGGAAMAQRKCLRPKTGGCICGAILAQR